MPFGSPAILPVSAVVPTRDRAEVLARTLGSLEAQSALPAELIVVDASDDDASRTIVEEFGARTAGACSVRWQAARERGAAAQRNEGVAIAASGHEIWFMDDDILFEPECVKRLWAALQSNAGLGGVSAMIVNQRYHPPGILSRTVFWLLHGRREISYAGKVLGPAVNLLPEDHNDLPEIVRVEWLNTTCTMYRREVLPDPPFPQHFTGYSLMEDVALSLTVGKWWRLANARTARIFHDSQPGDYKSDPEEMARMQLVNRHYVMAEILGRKRFMDYVRLFVWEIFQLAVCGIQRSSRPTIQAMIKGKWQAIRDLRSLSSATK